VAEFFGSPTINLIRGEIQRDNKLSFFGSGSIRLSLPDDIELPDGPVELGLRPEDWTIVNEEKLLSLEGVLERTENLGDSRILHFSTEYGRLTAKSDRRDFQSAQTYFLIPDWNRAHWFDISSGKRISG
jgi:multiple sugar transport system ATP-binding protein